MMDGLMLMIAALGGIGLRQRLMLIVPPAITTNVAAIVIAI
jgi:hypothetical protein